ncbi:hypothetical protein DPMN_118035 [Dreissena polymorpha]|uniref:Uncharacterized protein n=1 Tax=Dreissena polymorpha TaxID=45954 RepID=A0A9D4GGT0_DREPO|nr:hypothetical protein DPMN_118035 [Dreissena polymorpha]
MVKVIWSHNSSTACYLGILKNSCFRLNSQDFTLHEQANLRRSGVGKPSSVLDQEKLDLLRAGDCSMKCCSTYPKGEIRGVLLIAEHYAMVDVISKKCALPISTVEENMRWALRRLCVMYCGENI